MCCNANPGGLSGGVELAPGVFAAPDGLRYQFSRSGGPGGQNVNKLNTKAELWVRVSDLRGLHPEAMDRLRKLAGGRLTREDEIHIVAETSRTQEANREDALARLRELIVKAKHRPKARRATKPTAGARRRRLEAKKHRGQIKSQRKQLE